MSLFCILNNMDLSPLSFILNVVGWIIFFLIIKGYLFSYYSKEGENLATKEDVKEITKIVEYIKTKFTNKIEEFKRDLRVEERFKIEIEYVKARYKQIKKTTYKLILDLSKLELIINDTELLGAFQNLFKSVNTILIKHNFEMINDMVKLYDEKAEREYASVDVNNGWIERKTKLRKNFFNQLEENQKTLEPAIKNIKTITIVKLKEYAHIDNT